MRRKTRGMRRTKSDNEIGRETRRDFAGVVASRVRCDEMISPMTDVRTGALVDEKPGIDVAERGIVLLFMVPHGENRRWLRGMVWMFRRRRGSKIEVTSGADVVQKSEQCLSSR